MIINSLKISNTLQEIQQTIVGMHVNGYKNHEDDRTDRERGFVLGWGYGMPDGSFSDGEFEGPVKNDNDNRRAPEN